jgi:hypothetical protein
MTTTYEYKVVPFLGQAAAADKRAAEKVAEQLQQLVDQFVAQGWEFYRIDRVEIAVAPGCLAALSGGKMSFAGWDMVIFRRERQ